MINSNPQDFYIDGICSTFSDSVLRGIKVAEEMTAALNHASGERLAYHTHPYKMENGLVIENHAHRVFGFTMQLIQVLELAGVHLSGYEKGSALLDAAWHDVYMEFRVALVEMGAGMPLIEKTLRTPRVSEEKSADALTAFTHAENKRVCWELYTPHIVTLAHHGIILTTPIFVGNGVEQAITKKTPLAARLVPLADLGEAGLTGKVNTAIRQYFKPAEVSHYYAGDFIGAAKKAAK